MRRNNWDNTWPQIVAFAFGWFAILAIVSALMDLCGCAPVKDTTCARVFRDELLECVEKATTVEESHRCRDLVELRWGYPHE